MMTMTAARDRWRELLDDNSELIVQALISYLHQGGSKGLRGSQARAVDTDYGAIGVNFPGRVRIIGDCLCGIVAVVGDGIQLQGITDIQVDKIAAGAGALGRVAVVFEGHRGKA